MFEHGLNVRSNVGGVKYIIAVAPETREVCRACGEPWERWGCPTRRAVLLVGIYRREWKKQERIARRAMGWLAEVGSVAEWRDDPNHGALEFKMLVAKDVLALFRGDYLHAVLHRAHDAFKSAFSTRDNPSSASPSPVHPQDRTP